MSDTGTPFPQRLHEVVRAVEEIENHDGDIYETKIELDNGDWRVDIKYTDRELEEFTYTLYLNNHGDRLRVEEQR